MLDGFSFYHSVSFFLLLGGFLSLHPSLSSVSFCIAICWPLSLIFCVGPLLLPVSLTDCHLQPIGCSLSLCLSHTLFSLVLLSLPASTPSLFPSLLSPHLFLSPFPIFLLSLPNISLQAFSSSCVCVSLSPPPFWFSGCFSLSPPPCSSAFLSHSVSVSLSSSPPPPVSVSSLPHLLSFFLPAPVSLFLCGVWLSFFLYLPLPSLFLSLFLSPAPRPTATSYILPILFLPYPPHPYHKLPLKCHSSKSVPHDICGRYCHTGETWDSKSCLFVGLHYRKPLIPTSVEWYFLFFKKIVKALLYQMSHLFLRKFHIKSFKPYKLFHYKFLFEMHGSKNKYDHEGETKDLCISSFFSGKVYLKI